LFNSGLNCVEIATRAQRAVATTTSPAKGNADFLVFLVDATIVGQQDFSRYDYFNRFSVGFFRLFFSLIQKIFQISSLIIW
jgi:hypothetical protein